MGSRVRDIWNLSNRVRPVDAPLTRFVCTLYLTGYLLAAVLHPVGFDLLRLATLLYIGVGVGVAGRLTWTWLRRYTTGLALLLPLGTSYIHAAVGYEPGLLPITGLAMFCGVFFLQTGRDFVYVLVCLSLGHAALLALLPPPDAALTALLVVLGGTAIAATGAGLYLIARRVGVVRRLEQLQAALRTRSEFLDAMSKELHSPLDVIVGHARTLRAKASEPPGDVAERIHGSALELLRVVERALDATQLEARTMALHAEEFAPADVMRELADSIRRLPEARDGVPVNWKIAPNLPRVRLDKRKVREIVQHLVSNALRFTHEGVVCVRVERDGDRLKIAVADSGPGIPFEAQERVFEMFERVDGGGAQQPATTGLGLYITKGLVELMHGRIELTSEPGQGALFTVRLPLDLTAPVVAAPAGVLSDEDAELAAMAASVVTAPRAGAEAVAASPGDPGRRAPYPQGHSRPESARTRRSKRRRGSNR